MLPQIRNPTRISARQSRAGTDIDAVEPERDQITDIVGTAFGFCSRAAAADQQRIEPELIAAEHRLPMGVLAAANRDDAVVARHIAGAAPRHDFFKVAPTPAQSSGGVSTNRRETNPFVVKDRVRPGIGLKAALAIPHYLFVTRGRVNKTLTHYVPD